MTAAPVATSTWQIDPVHSTAEFALTHMPFSIFRGRFRDVAGEITLDEATPENSSVRATIQTASIDVLGERFQEVLQGEEFFNTPRWPTITFGSTRVERVDGTTWNVIGSLTIRDVTREVTLVTRYGGQGKTPTSGRTLSGSWSQAPPTWAPACASRSTSRRSVRRASRANLPSAPAERKRYGVCHSEDPMALRTATRASKPLSPRAKRGVSFLGLSWERSEESRLPDKYAPHEVPRSVRHDGSISAMPVALAHAEGVIAAA
jgi:polyisoprenoid-binding protein YceI